MTTNDTTLPWGELPGPPVAVEPLGGQSTGAWLATYADGTQVVRKRAGHLGEAAAGRDLVALTDAEELGPKVLGALGLRAAAVQRLGERDVRMEYVKGTRGSVYSHFPSGEAEAWVVESSEGRLLGLADHVMANHDRHGGNWLFTADEELVGIDHGNAFTDDHACTSQFADALYAPSDKDRTAWNLADRNDFSPADLVEARHRLNALRPEFDRLGRGEWHDAMLRRLGEVEQHAAGTRRRIPAAGPREWPGTDYDTTAGSWPVTDQDIPTQRTVPERTTDMTRSSDTGPTRPAHVADRAAAEAGMAEYLRARAAGHSWESSLTAAYDVTCDAAESTAPGIAVKWFAERLSTGMPEDTARALAVSEAVADSALIQFTALRAQGRSIEEATAAVTGDSSVATDAVTEYVSLLNAGFEEGIARADAGNAAVVAAGQRHDDGPDHAAVSGDVPADLDLAAAVDLVVRDYRDEMGPEVPAVAAVVGTREQLTDWDLGYLASDRPDIPAEVVTAMGIVRDANAADLASVLGVPAEQCGQVFHGAADTEADDYWQHEETVPERDPEPESWIDRNLPTPAAREVPDGFEPDIAGRDEDDLEQVRVDRAEVGAAPYTGEPEIVTINPAELMPAEEALRNFDLADTAVSDYEQHRALGLDDDAAARAVAQTHGALAESAIALFRDAVAAGNGHEAARQSAVVEAADRATPRVTAEQAAKISAAFADPEPTRERDVVADPPRDVADIREAVRTLPEGTISDADLTRVGVTAEEYSRLVDDDMDREAEQWQRDHTTADTAAEPAATPDAPRSVHSATDAALERIDAVLAEPDVPPWEEQVERCGQSVRAAAKAVGRVEDADRAERLASWNADDTDTTGIDHEWGQG